MIQLDKVGYDTYETGSARKKEVQLPNNLICFSHLRWDFVFQRPQHLLTRFLKHFTIHFIEEPVFDAELPYYSFSERSENLTLVVPHLVPGMNEEQISAAQEALLAKFLQQEDLMDYAFWYYTPMALAFSHGFRPALTIYDCMDELSAFKFAPSQLQILEKELLKRANIVFTGGQSLYHAKRDMHHTIYPFPSSIDKGHFGKSRGQITPPQDQAGIPQPRLGFYGVIDERFDLDLIEEVARQRPAWQFVLIGPVVKIDPSSLPKLPNIHFLGTKCYEELPGYLAGWDIALIPFLLNESTRFISPTKTPEYLSAGIPVISTPIQDVVYPYGEEGIVQIISTPQELICASEKILNQQFDRQEWLTQVDAFLADKSWDSTVENMVERIRDCFFTKSIY
ncbi:glycosyltransferase family 1 protein [Arundinibacter roseus]|uniref:Glycosyltransferase family 1 protein n=1 Tax=Arundinibacter roseus TaxID=2070510 RepID=A0A4R4KHX7_9BACT|nr:glycosyltransferase family 1 protein [Arundinibacter roseus]TDB67423.1 glycosyltransferase family 1 protein [Arundinibacter roseus]